MQYKVGDKVRVRKDLVEDTYYGSRYFNDSMCDFRGKEVTISCIIEDHHYLIMEDSWDWTDEMFDPSTKTLSDLQKGDVIFDIYKREYLVLARLEDIIFLSGAGTKDNVEEFIAIHELETRGFVLEQPTYEVSRQQIAEKFNIDVDKLKIK